GEVAMRAADLARLVVQRHDLGHLVVEETVHRVGPGPAVGQLSGGAALGPPPRPTLAELQLTAGAPERPAGLDGVGEQVQQVGLGGLVDAGGDSATQPQRPFPSTSINLTAISLR